ncbi:MAG: ATP-binding cassette domain-containing protein, partial [Selenomonadaceae bacterium]|nr:ATP-binding cassette domain-containing protein [Selenomonadaceae bacterium]
MFAKLLPALFSGINGALIMAIGGFSVMEGTMTAGMFIAFRQLMENFQAPVNALLGLGSSLQTTEMQLQRLNDVRRYEIDHLNFPGTREKKQQSFPRNRLSGDLVLQDVSFGYSPLEKPLLNHFGLHARPGAWVAVVGASGSGKSTLARIVTGLYEEWSGTVAFDGIARRKLPGIHRASGSKGTLHAIRCHQHFTGNGETTGFDGSPAPPPAEGQHADAPGDAAGRMA